MTSFETRDKCKIISFRRRGKNKIISLGSRDKSSIISLGLWNKIKTTMILTTRWHNKRLLWPRYFGGEGVVSKSEGERKRGRRVRSFLRNRFSTRRSRRKL